MIFQYVPISPTKKEIYSKHIINNMLLSSNKAKTAIRQTSHKWSYGPVLSSNMGEIIASTPHMWPRIM